ncbi:hypothetical protein FE257_011995 [Aspergillus nanangensis]|uniref:Acetyl-CoA acetyltransferase n=1 Tax=Aspergillus nanangensis TaxID=2582783 RepID=A0AAD4CGS4_ASPNN|nr:hypothetical protein FE257_011995 [Aspergillus nanangensis]
MKHNIPIIVGVGEAKNPSTACSDAIEPVELMLQAIANGLQDTAIPQTGIHSLAGDVDLMSVVANTSWPYDDLPRLLADQIGAKTCQTAYSELTGNSPVQMIDDTAQLIAKGQIEVGVVVGGEAFASVKSFIKSNTYPPPWTPPKSGLQKLYYANDIDMLTGVEKTHQIGVPFQVYPLYENGFRAQQGQTILENHQESSHLYGQFASTAAGHPMAWNYGKHPQTASSINPLLMNAFNDVNISGACILTSTSYAERVGIPKDKWIYPLGAGRGEDAEEFWKRPNFHSSPAIAKALDTALKSSGIDKEEIDLFDFYSCFPIVPKLACQHLGIPLLDSPRPITLLGGLNSFGGAGANYSMHAVAEMTRQIRKLHHEHKPARGLVLANGGVLTHENAICLSSAPPTPGASYPEHEEEILPRKNEQDSVPQLDVTAEGKAFVEAIK